MRALAVAFSASRGTDRTGYSDTAKVAIAKLRQNLEGRLTAALSQGRIFVK